ncbi:MAG: tetratricopeptide repeat protein, partial [Gemmatimonadetes bacterium]|nr:tetratricopeptide repeat protein [Gemmatimonadota bacterium]
LLNAGHIAGQLRRYDEAIAYCRRAVAVRPDDAEGWYLLGLGLFSNGERAAAEQALRRSLALSADDTALHTKTQQLLNTIKQQPTETP